MQHEALELLPAPQISCPMSLSEYSKQFKFWARRDVIKRQGAMARHRQLIKAVVNQTPEAQS